MIHIMIRVWLLWGAFTFAVQWTFGINQWTHMREIIEVSTPQVEAFVSGITSVGWQQLPVAMIPILLPIFTRRIWITLVKQGGTMLFYLFLVRHWRRFVSRTMLLPGKMTSKGVSHVRTWYQLQNHLLLNGWFLCAYSAVVLTLGTFVSSQILLKIITGTLTLDPFWVKVEAQVLTFVGAYIVATLAQSVLMFVWKYIWKLILVITPQFVREYVYDNRRFIFRIVITIRKRRRRVFIFWSLVAVFCSIPI